MKNKNLSEKIQDLVFWTVVFLILYFITAFLLKSSWLQVALTLPETYEILKDSLTITATILAPVTALLLFSDWREQHVLTLIDTASRKIAEDIYDLYILTVQAYYKDPIQINEHDIQLYEHSIKGSLHDIRRNIEINENIIRNSDGNHRDLLFNLILFREISLDTENNIRAKKYAANKIKEIKAKKYIISELGEHQYLEIVANQRKLYDSNLKKMKNLYDCLQKQLKEIQI